jgi:hypothetical protein
MVCLPRASGLTDNRLNTKLESQRLEPMTDLVKDFSDGVKLIQVSASSPYLTMIKLMASCLSVSWTLPRAMY